MRRGFLNNSKVKKQPLYTGSPDPPPVCNGPISVPTTTEKVKTPVNLTKTSPSGTQLSGVLEDRKSDTEIFEAIYPAYSLVVVTVPTRIADEPPNPDGYSEWIVHTPTTCKIVNQPGYPQPVPELSGPPSYITRSTPNMGVGMFATRDISVGELIFAERPLLVTPRNVSLFGRDLPKDCTSTFQGMTIWEWEMQLEIMVGRMNLENQTAFKALAYPHHADSNERPLLGILHTNGFVISQPFDGDGMYPTAATAYTAVANLGSRINHSCMPNITRNFNMASFSLQFTARCDIKADEQLFDSYCAIDQSAAERQIELARYGFVCQCRACLNATPETDQLRQEYVQRTLDYTAKMFECIATPYVAEGVLDPILQFREALLEEGLHVTASYPTVLLLIHNFYARLRLSEKAKFYFEEYERYMKAIV